MTQTVLWRQNTPLPQPLTRWGLFVGGMFLWFLGFAGAEAWAQGGFHDPVMVRHGLANASGGSGSVTGGRDLSVLDGNPAYLSLGRQVQGGGHFVWTKNNSQAVEAGVMDSYLSDLSAGIKVRQTMPAAGPEARRFTLGLSQPVEQSGIVFGIAGDYVQFLEEKNHSESLGQAKSDIKKNKNINLRFGLTSQVAERVIMGVRSDGYFNSSASVEHGVGLLFLINPSTGVLGDAVFDKRLVKQYSLGFMISAQNFLDLVGSYTQRRNGDNSGFSGGVVLKAPKISISYFVRQPVHSGAPLEHEAVALVTFAGL